MTPEELRVLGAARRSRTGGRLPVRSRRWLIMMSVVHTVLTQYSVNHYN